MAMKIFDFRQIKHFYTSTIHNINLKNVILMSTCIHIICHFITIRMLIIVFDTLYYIINVGVVAHKCCEVIEDSTAVGFVNL